MKKSLVFAAQAMAICLLFSCTSDIESTEEDLEKEESSSSLVPSSSSSLPSGMVLCVLSGICTEISAEGCDLLSGTPVQSCPESSSSAQPSSSSVASSSSSVAPSSSSIATSSSSFGGGYTGSYGSLPYEGQTYKTVVIGTQTWMAENLNYAPSSGTFISCDTYDCNAYGRLYDWSTAMGLPSSCNSTSCSSQIQTKHRGVCPSGWHIPSDEDWDALVTYADGYSMAGTKLKAASGWNGNGNGTDDYGFSALPGGGGYSGGSFGTTVGSYGHWWSAMESSASDAYGRFMYYDFSLVVMDIINKSLLFSVRCVQD